MTYPNTLLKLFFKLFTITSLLFLLVLAIYVICTRVAFKFLPDYHQTLLEFISVESNQQITVDSIEAYWDKFNPIFKIKGFKYDENAAHANPSIRIDHISLSFSFIKSLLALQPRFDQILISDSQINLEQRPNGDWLLQNGNLSDSNTRAPEPENDEEFLKLLAVFSGSTINVKNLNAIIFNEKGKVRTLRLPSLNMNYREDSISASGQVLQKKNDQVLLDFSLQGRGSETSQYFKTVLFLEARSSEFFGELLGVYNWNKISIQNIDGSARAWLNFNDFDISSIFGDIEINRIDWQASESVQAPIDKFAFSFLYEDKNAIKHVSLDNLALEWAGNKCAPTDVKVTISSELLRFKSNIADLHCVSELSQVLNFLPEKLNDRLMVSQPKGYLKNISLMLPLENEMQALNVDNPQITVPYEPILKTSNEIVTYLNESLIPTNYRLEAELDQVSLNAYFSTPSVENVNGYLIAQDKFGYVSFLSENFELGFPTLFLNPWHISRAEGLVSWQTEQSEIVVSSDGIRLRRDDNSLIYGDFKLLLNDTNHEDYLNLALAMQDLKILDATKFVPYHAVSHNLYDWLDKSLTSGSVSSGIYYGHGSVEHGAPKHSFTSSILLNTKSGSVLFDPEWPALEELDSKIVIQNGQLDISSEKASISGTNLTNLIAHLPSHKGSETASILRIHSDADVSKKQIDYWLTQSPIAENTKDVAEQLIIDTEASVNIELGIPVSQPSDSKNRVDTSYTITTNLKNANISHRSTDLHFTHLNGVLSVDSTKGIYSDLMTATLFDEPVTLGVSTEALKSHSREKQVAKSSSNPHLTMIDLKGAADVTKLMSHYDLSDIKSLKGQLSYHASLSLPSDKTKYPIVNLRSNLLGLNCYCPLPFAKNGEETSDLWISLLIKPDQYYVEGSIKSSKHPSINTELFFTEDGFSFGEVLINGATHKNSSMKGLNIAANLKRANLDSWITFINELYPENKQADPTQTNNLSEIQLYVEDLDAYGYLLQKNYVVIKPKEAIWHLDLDGKDIKGNIVLANERQPLTLNLKSLNLVSIDGLLEKNHKELVKNKDKINPTELSELSFSVKDLSIEGRSSGAWSLLLVPNDTGALIKNIQGHVKGNKITGQINWRYDDSNKYNIVESSIATFDVIGGDVSYLFEAFDMPVLMSSKKTNAEISLHWPKPPSEFSLEKLSGKVKLSFSDGFLKTEDEKTGVLRLFGVLNAESIKRRLKLDFSDLYKSGVGFDTFDAEASIDQGLLTLTAPLLIDGPAGKYVLNGRSDLSSKALDIDMLVELPFSQNVPLAALVLGAPQIGGLVWVADKLLGEPLSALTTSRYDITGTWDEPVVNLQQALNASKKDRSNEKGNRDVAK